MNSILKFVGCEWCDSFNLSVRMSGIGKSFWFTCSIHAPWEKFISLDFLGRKHGSACKMNEWMNPFFNAGKCALDFISFIFNHTHLHLWARTSTNPLHAIHFDKKYRSGIELAAKIQWSQLGKAILFIWFSFNLISLCCWCCCYFAVHFTKPNKILSNHGANPSEHCCCLGFLLVCVSISK